MKTRTLLNYANDKRFDEVKQILLMSPKNSFDINGQDDYGFTVLMYAILDDQDDLCKFLLKMPEINVNIKTLTGNTALTYAVLRQNTEIIKLLLDFPGININSRNEKGSSALRIAKYFNFTEIIELLEKAKL